MTKGDAMTGEIREKVLRLLLPTHDATGWRAQFETLNANEAVPILLGILNNNLETAQVRSRAAALLGMLRDARALTPLIEALRSHEALVRARAAVALGQMGVLDEKVTEALIRGLNDEDYFVRECCARALGSLKCVQALFPLESMSSTDSVSTNREVAQEAIKAIRG